MTTSFLSFSRHFVIVLSFSLATQAARSGERWTIDPEAVLVIGQDDFTSAEIRDGDAGFFNANDVAVDPATGKVFVAQANQNRVLRYPQFSSLSNGDNPEAVFGQPDFETYDLTTTSTGMIQPLEVTVDSDGNLWVADAGNARILRFANASTIETGAAADSVLGQDDFTTGETGLSDSEFNAPSGLAVDPSGNLFVADTGNSRVLVFLNAANASNGAAASIVLGQEDFTSPGIATSRDGMEGPRGLACDANGNLYVVDRGNDRVLRFDNAAGKSSGADADGVLGQEDFDTSRIGDNDDRFWGPVDATVDAEGRLWVSEFSNRRAVGFSNPLTVGNGGAADLILCQPDFDIVETGLTGSRIGPADGIATDSSGRVYLVDAAQRRILVFEKDLHLPDIRVGKKSSAPKGNNVFNASGSGQRETVKIEGKEIKLQMRVDNEGNIPDTYRIQARGSNSKFRIKLFQTTGGRVNITGGAKAGTHISPSIAARGILALEHRTKPKGKFRKKRATMKAWVDAISTTDGERDRAVGKIKNRP